MENEEVSQYSKEVAKGSFWSLAGSMFFKLVSFAYVVLLARAASADDVGLFYLSLSIMSLIMVFSDMGLPASLSRYIPYFEGKNERRNIVALLRTNYIFVGVLSFLIGVLAWWQADNIGIVYRNARLPEAIRVLSAYVVLYNLFRINTFYLQGRRDIKSMQLAMNSQNLLKLALTIAFFHFFGASVTTIAVAFMLSYLIAWLVSFPALQKNSHDFPPTAPILDIALLSEVIPFGLMLTLLGSFWVLISSMDRILLGYLLPPSNATETVAIYSIASTFAFVLMAFPGSIENIFLPLISRLVGKNELAQVRSVTETAQRWTLLLTIPISIVMMLFADDMLSMFYGSVYRSGAMAMAIITLAFLIRSVSYMPSLVLAAMRMIKLELKITLAVAAANMVLNIVLIPPYGMEGSAVALLISFVIMFVLFTYYGKKIFGFTFPPETYKLAVSGVAAFIIVLVLKQPLSGFTALIPQFGTGEILAYSSKVLYLVYLGFLVLLSVSIFVVLSFLFRCLHKEDVSLMKKVIARAGAPQWVVVLVEKVALYGVHR